MDWVNSFYIIFLNNVNIFKYKYKRGSANPDPGAWDGAFVNESKVSPFEE